MFMFIAVVITLMLVAAKLFAGYQIGWWMAILAPLAIGFVVQVIWGVIFDR